MRTRRPIDGSRHRHRQPRCPTGAAPRRRRPAGAHRVPAGIGASARRRRGGLRRDDRQYAPYRVRRHRGALPGRPGEHRRRVRPRGAAARIASIGPDRHPVHPAVCARHGIAVLAPGNADRAWIHQRYVGQFLEGEFREDTRQEFIALISRLRREDHIDGVILGGTELPLLLPAPVIGDVPALDTTALHVSAIVSRLRQAGSGSLRTGMERPDSR
jgi:Asp/Glu/Hydantoin racemase